MNMNKIYNIVGKIVVSYTLCKFTEGVIEGLIEMGKKSKKEEPEQEDKA